MGGHAPESGEIIGIVQKLKDDMSADPADSQKADEKDRWSDHVTLVQAKDNEIATLTATIQGDLGVEVDSMKGDLAETENSFAGDEASSEWEEQTDSGAHEGGHDIHSRLQHGSWPAGHVGADRARGQDRRRLA